MWPGQLDGVRCHRQKLRRHCPPWPGSGLWIPGAWRRCDWVPREAPCARAAMPQPSSEGAAAEAPTLDVWLVTISAATQVLTSSALRRSCSRYLSWT